MKISIVRDVINKNYGPNRTADAPFFRAPTACPRCMCELCFVLRDDPWRKTMSCQNCSYIFQTQELHAS